MPSTQPNIKQCLKEATSMRMILSSAAAALALLSSNVAQPQELEPNTICIAASKPGIIKSRNESACRGSVRSQSFRVMMNVGEEGDTNNQTVVFLPNGISFQLMCGGVGRARLHWVFASNETTPAVVQIDQLPPQELEPFDLRPDPSGPDLSFASFSTETEDDRMAILNVPVMSLLADDRTELRITDARAQLKYQRSGLHGNRHANRDPTLKARVLQEASN